MRYTGRRGVGDGLDPVAEVVSEIGESRAGLGIVQTTVPPGGVIEPVGEPSARQGGAGQLLLQVVVAPVTGIVIPITNKFYYFSADKIKSKLVKEATWLGRID